MSGRQSRRNDLVIGMTLAEVFLLLLIVGWYGSKLESEEGNPTVTPAEVLQAQVDGLQKQVTNLQDENESLKRRLKATDEILDWLGKYLNLDGPPESRGEVERGLASKKRGKAACIE